MVYLQYFVFDKEGRNILVASVIKTDNTEKALETMVSNYKTNPIFKNTQLTISCGSEILFSSTTGAEGE